MELPLSTEEDSLPTKFNTFSADPSKYNALVTTAPPNIELERLGGFSLSHSGTQMEDDSNLRHLLSSGQMKVLRKRLRPNLENLTEGMSSFVAKDNDPALTDILEWIQFKQSQHNDNDPLHGVHFVCWRGALTRLCTSGYECNDRYDVGFKLACRKHGGICYLREYSTDKKAAVEEHNKLDPYLRKAIYAGFKFEQIVSVPRKGDKKGEEKEGQRTTARAEVVDTNNQYAGMFRATLYAPASFNGDKNERQPIKLLFGAEIDCEDAETGELVEVKTNFKSNWMKDLRWWAQSYLVGIQRMLVGMRDRNFFLERVEEHRTDSLRTKEGSVCFAFLYAFLSHLKDLMDRLPEGSILLAERLDATAVFTFSLIPISEARMQQKYAFLPATFTESL